MVAESVDCEGKDDFDIDLDHQELLINGDLNDLLDQEINPAISSRRDKPMGGSTHVSSLAKSPFEQSDTRQAFTSIQSTSQRSSFDDSFNDQLHPFLSLNSTLNPRSFVGEGLFKL